MTRRALYAAIHAWTSPIRVGSHAIATQLARGGWEVAYVAAPITPLHWLRRSRAEFAWRLAEHRAGGGTDLDGRLWHYVPYATLAPDNRPLLNGAWLFDHWHRLTSPDLVALLRERGFGEVDLLVLDTLFQPFWLEAVGHRKSAVRLADLNAGFPGYGPGSAAVERRIVSGADCVLTAAAGLDAVATDLGAKRVIRVPNGIDFARFEGPAPPPPPEYAAWNSPVAVYVGALAGWVDLALVEACARAHPGMAFALIGPEPEGGVPLPQLPNVHYLGRKPPGEIPAYLRHAAVGLIPFRSAQLDALIGHVNPLKLYEYLAAGLPVVATDWPALRETGSPARLCAGTEAFVAAVGEAVRARGDDAPRIAFARECDWSRRVAPFLEWARDP
jgi:glycosyltransferase involved in cell wall biosynthesis